MIAARPESAARLGTIEHRHSEDPPTRMQKSEIRLLRRERSPASTPQLCSRILWNTLIFDLKAVPFELLNGAVAGTNRQVGDQLPIDLLPVLWARRPRSLDAGDIVPDVLAAEGAISRLRWAFRSSHFTSMRLMTKFAWSVANASAVMR